MMPEKLNIGGIVHKVRLEDEKSLKLALKKLGVKNWQRRYSYWDVIDAVIYISRDLPEELQEFFLCLEALKAMSYYIGDKLWENERILRPYATLMRLLLRSYSSNRAGESVRDDDRQKYIH